MAKSLREVKEGQNIKIYLNDAVASNPDLKCKFYNGPNNSFEDTLDSDFYLEGEFNYARQLHDGSMEIRLWHADVVYRKPEFSKLKGKKIFSTIGRPDHTSKLEELSELEKHGHGKEYLDAVGQMRIKTDPLKDSYLKIVVPEKIISSVVPKPEDSLPQIYNFYKQDQD